MKIIYWILAILFAAALSVILLFFAVMEGWSNHG